MYMVLSYGALIFHYLKVDIMHENNVLRKLNHQES